MSGADYYVSSASNRSLRYVNNSLLPDPVSPPTGQRLNYVPSLKLAFIDGPTIVVNEALTEFFTCSGLADIQSFNVSAYQLTNDLYIAAPTGYQISLNQNSGYASTILINQIAGIVDDTNIYVRLDSSAVSGLSGNIILSSNGANNITIPTGNSFVADGSLYVATDGSNSNLGTSPASPYATVSYAISRKICPSIVIMLLQELIPRMTLEYLMDLQISPLLVLVWMPQFLMEINLIADLFLTILHLRAKHYYF